MKIGIKLILSFLVVTLFLAAVGYISTSITQKALEKNIGRSSAVLAQTTLNKIDRDIFNKIQIFRDALSDPRLQQVILDSNQEFSNIDNLKSYIQDREDRWKLVDSNQDKDFLNSLSDNPLARVLKRHLRFFSGEYGYPVFGEIFVTNRYGVNIAQTGVTSDYYQADEHWWVEAKEKGIFVEDVKFDESSNITGINLCLRINDKNGNFLGILRAIANFDAFVRIINSVEQAETDEALRLSSKNVSVPVFQLRSKSGSLIYSSDPTFLKDSSFNFEKFLNNKTHFFADKQKKQEERFIAYAQSKGFDQYEGLGWFLILSYKSSKVFSDVNRIKTIILLVSLISIGLSALIGFLISDSIAIQLLKLKNAALDIGSGNLNAKIDVDSEDELGELAQSFRQMALNLKDVTASRDDLNCEILSRKKVEQALRVEKDLARQYLDIAGVMMLALDQEGNIILINERGCEILGYKKHEILGKNWFEMFLSQKVVGRVKEVHNRLMAGETELLRYYENIILTKRGEERNILWNNSTLKSADGKCLGILSSGEDVTERRKNEKIISLQRDLGIALSSRHSLKNATDDLLGALLELEEFDCGAVYLIDKNEKKPQMVVHRGFTYEFASSIEALELNEEKARDMFAGHSIYGLHEEMNFSTDKACGEEGLRAVALIPAEDRSEIVAVILLASHIFKETSLLTRNSIEVIASRLGGVIARIQTEEELVESEKRYRIMSEQTGQLVYAYDIVSGRIYWSGAIERVTGYPSEEYRDFRIEQWTDHIHPDDRTEAITVLNERMKNLQPYEVEYRFRQRNKNYIYVEDHGVFLPDENGVVERMIGTMNDITKRKESERALRKSEEKYRALVEGANSIILRMDEKGNVVFVNDFAQKFFGYHIDDIVGKSVVGTIVPLTDDSGRDLKRMIDDICIHPDRYALNENQNIRKNGSKMWVAWTNKVTVNDLGQKEVLCIGADVTQRKQAEQKLESMFLDLQKVHKQLKQTQQQLLQSEKMAAIGQLSAGVAHEVKNPLSIILLSAGVLEDKIKKLGEGGKKHLKMITDAAERANKVVVDLLNFSRYSEIELIEVSLHEALKSIISLAQNTFKGKDISFNMNFSAREIIVQADRILLEQIFFNLFANAIDSIDSKGEIVITTSILDGEKEAVIEVQDTGSGMSREVQKKIFEPFYTTKEQGKGTGLGLSTVYMILERHGGKISVESEVGSGSNFFVTFPVVRA